MAIARDVHSKVAGSTNTGKTLSLTIASSAVLFAATYSEDATLPTCAWGGTSMTQIASMLNPDGLGYYLTLFFLGNPTSGTNNLISNCPSTYNSLYGASYTGALTANPVSTSNTAHGSNILTTTATLSTTGNAWYFGIANGTSLTGGANATLLDTDNPTFQADFDSNGIASSTSMTINRTPSGRLALLACAFQAVATQTVFYKQAVSLGINI